MSPGANNQYRILGKLLVKTRPEVATELIDTYLNGNIESVETDLTKIPRYFTAYCQAEGITIDIYHHLRKKDKMKHRRLFVAVMLHLYNPQVFVDYKVISLNQGFVMTVSNTLQFDRADTSKIIRIVVTHERAYADFREKVESIKAKISGVGFTLNTK